MALFAYFNENDSIEDSKNNLYLYIKKNNLELKSSIIFNKKIDTKRQEFISNRVNNGDTLIVNSIKDFGINILETLNIINFLIEKNITIIFINEIELSTKNKNIDTKTMYRYFLDIQKEYISKRTKIGLAAIKAKGVTLGRPKGKRNKNRILDPVKKDILEQLNLGINVNKILKTINSKIEKPISYSTLLYFINNNKKLKEARANYRKGSLLHKNN